MPSNNTTTIKKNDPRDLRLVTAGQGISMVGTAISDLAIPIMAVDLLGANSFGTGLLGAWSLACRRASGLTDCRAGSSCSPQMWCARF
jgi:hypothetical protein